MNLKKFLRIASVVTLMAITLPATSAIVVPESTTTNTTTIPEDPKVQQMLQRLEYIKGMDKSELTRLEKKALRKEVREIKKEMKEVKGGIYLSIGAIIIVILLLILLL
jgi:predicted PurR-regulated permease PerM